MYIGVLAVLAIGSEFFFDTFSDNFWRSMNKNKLFDDVIPVRFPNMPPGCGDDDDDDDDEDEDEDEPAPKKKKVAAPAEKKEKNFFVETVSGEECPKKIKDLQQRALKRSEFLADAPEMKLDIWGNKLTGLPRAFSSDNMGWYTGGKIEVEINGKKIWASAGINVTIMGSKDWKK